LKHLGSTVTGNHDELEEINEDISTNYAESGELYNRMTTTIDIYFASKIASSMDNNSEPKSMAECQKHLDWDKYKKAIEV
jgi:hypothetical protein